MRNSINKLLVAALICLLPQIQAVASSHREAPLISADPLADNTDLYVFRSPCDTNNIVIIANYIPFEHPAGGPNWFNFGRTYGMRSTSKTRPQQPVMILPTGLHSHRLIRIQQRSSISAWESRMLWISIPASGVWMAG